MRVEENSRPSILGDSRSRLARALYLILVYLQDKFSSYAPVAYLDLAEGSIEVRIKCFAFIESDNILHCKHTMLLQNTIKLASCTTFYDKPQMSAGSRFSLLFSSNGNKSSL